MVVRSLVVLSEAVGESLCRRGADIPSSLLQAGVALFVGATGAEADAHKGGPGAALEYEDGEDHAEAET